MHEVMVCPNCGAHVPPPVEVDAMFATCNHCHFRTALSVQWVEARQRQQAAIDQRRHADELRAEERKSRSKERLVWGLGFGGMFVVIVGFTLFSVGRSLWGSAKEREQRAAEAKAVQAASEARLAVLRSTVEQLKQQGCAREVSAAVAGVGPHESTLTMNEQGDCLRVAATAESKVTARIVAPSGKPTEASGEGLLNFEYCPRESGEHSFALTVPEDAVIAHALLQCPSAFEKHKDDPAKNGMSKARTRLSALEKAGCKRVIMAPQPVTGNRSLTATMEPGRFCTVLVASAGDAQNLLQVKMTSPMGEVIGSPRPAHDLALAHCAQVAGEHAVSVAPASHDYYTLAAMDCPRKVAIEYGAR